MANINTTKTSPIQVPRTMRVQDVRNLTSLPAGRVVPICAIPLMREDSIRRFELRLSFEMMETVEVLMNAVNVDVKAYFVSNLAMDRFDGMDALNRSYSKIAVEGLTAVPFIETAAAGDFSVLPFWKYLGKHAKTADVINVNYLEAYNQIWNFRARNRSQDLTQRTRLDTTLAPAFWKHTNFQHVVPSFDQAIIDGEVPLNVVSGQLPVTGIGIRQPSGLWTAGTGSDNVKETGKTAVTNYPFYRPGNATGVNEILIRGASAAAGAAPLVFAEMQANGITVSLSNIELARKTQAFARLKEQYQGLTDEYIIDLLMSGISVPEQALNQPILVAENSTIFGMSKRYATDSGALTDSVVNGATFLDLNMRVPQMNPGGVLMVTCEITPEQLFERQRDPWLHTTDVTQLPDYLRDTLDPEKVEAVLNGQIDAAHNTPTGTFGYEPLNARWMTIQPNIGGRYYRKDPASVTNDEDRQRIWAVETVNPTLAADFYICTNIHTKPFVVQNQDPFECVSRGMCAIEGNTVFGGALIESTGSYDEVMAKAPMGRLPTNTTMLAEETEPVEQAAVKPAGKPISKRPPVQSGADDA